MKWTAAALLSAFIGLAGCSSKAGVEVGPQVAIVGAEGSDRVWVCHRGRWQEVAAPAADAHGRHGDRVSTAPRRDRESC